MRFEEYGSKMSTDRRYQLIAKQIIGLIESGEFPVGSRLPGERELAERFGVSRVTIREAEIALEAQGYILIRTGSGVYVQARQTCELNFQTDVNAFELTTTRAVIESEAAALAALNITPSALEALEETLRVMARNGDDAEDADEAFHTIIAQNTGSPIIEHFVRTLWRIRNEAPQVAHVYNNVCQSGFEDRVDEHRGVLEAIRNRDPNAARNAMREHFRRLFEAMLMAEEKETLAELRKKTLEHRDRFKLSTQHSTA